MMGTLSIASWGLLIGAMGQAGFYSDFFSHHLPGWVFGILFVPWFTVFGISFCKQPPCGPRPFRHFLIFAMCWYAVTMLLAEILHFVIQPPPLGHFSLIVARFLMYGFGAASFFVFIRACIVLRRYEKKPDA